MYGYEIRFGVQVQLPDKGKVYLYITLERRLGIPQDPGGYRLTSLSYNEGLDR